MATRQTSDLKNLFNCIICLEQSKDARLCPHCSKPACYRCIREWLTQQDSQCPHCRNHVNLGELFRCRWADELVEGIDRLQKEAGNAPKDRCNVHNEKRSVYCSTCQACLCYHCAFFSGQHAGHDLKPLQEEYKVHVERVTPEIDNLRRRLAYLNNAFRQLETDEDAVRHAKEETARQLRIAVEQMIARLDVPMKHKIDAIAGQKEAIIAEVEIVESLVHEMEPCVASLSQAQMISRSADILQSLGEVYSKNQAYREPVSFNFVSEIIPRYNCHTMILQNFTELRSKGEPVFSTPLVIHGVTWRLKVYPDGFGSHLAVYLELTNGPTEASKYEYQLELELVHSGGDPSRNIVVECVGDFDVVKSWGCARFFELDRLATEGFLDVSDSLTLRFKVRAPTYYQKCKDYLWHINKLETAFAAQQAEVDGLCTQQLHANSVNSVPSPSEQEVGESSGQQKCDDL